MTDLDRTGALRLEQLEARVRIEELRASYCFLVDDRRYDELVDTCFTSDALCDFRARSAAVEPMISRGREEIRGFFKQVVDVLLDGMSHTVHNHRITIDGDRASGDCYFELTAIDATSGDAIVGAGRYIDRYRRVEGRWLFEERRADLFHIAPLAEGWARRPFVAALTSGRRAEGS